MTSLGHHILQWKNLENRLPFCTVPSYEALKLANNRMVNKNHPILSQRKGVLAGYEARTDRED